MLSPGAAHRAAAAAREAASYAASSGIVIGRPRTGDAVVWFTNSGRGLRLGRLLLPHLLPGEHRALDWLQVGATLDA